MLVSLTACRACVHTLLHCFFNWYVHFAACFHCISSIYALKKIVIRTFPHLLNMVQHSQLVFTTCPSNMALSKNTIMSKKKRPVCCPPTAFALQKFTKCHPTVFWWWGMVPHGHIILYFGCTIFAGPEMGTLVAIHFLPTLKIFFPTKKTIRLTLAWTFAPKTPRDTLLLVLSMIIGVIKIVEQCSDFLYTP